MTDQMDKLRKELIFQLKGGNAHTKFDDVLKNFPENLRGTAPAGMPYSAWQLLEHIRIAQDDILRYCKNSDGSYKEMKWPDDYWPKGPAPTSASAWTDSIKGYHTDLDEFIELISDPKAELFEAFPWGDGQTLFHEAMLLVDHAAYHLGEIVAVRRILKSWPSK
jgi:hypothetical protein